LTQNPVPVDQKERALTLDTRQSFLVQAPAGSGKTELLTRRLLKLLSEVDEPEQILAITFTLAATAEMRARVLTALQARVESAAATAAAEHSNHRLGLPGDRARNSSALAAGRIA